MYWRTERLMEEGKGPVTPDRGIKDIRLEQYQNGDRRVDIR